MSIVILMLLTTLALEGHAQSAVPNASDQAITLLRQQIGVDNAAPNQSNPQGLRIQFQKIDDVQMADGHSVRFRLLAPGAPEKTPYMLAVWRIGVEIKNTPDLVYTNAKGLVMWHQPTPDQENKDALDRAYEIEVDLKAARGEPIRYMLTSADGKMFFPGTVVPYPIESKDGKCRLEARLGFPDADALLVYADGLPPGALVPLQSVSEGETHTPMIIPDAHGHAVAVVAPIVTGKEAGLVKISVGIQGCSVGVEVPWGKGSYRPL